MFRATFNRRVVYFASLQEISDSVSFFSSGFPVGFSYVQTGYCTRV